MKTPQVDDNAMYRAITSFSSEDPPGTLITRGMRLRGANVIVEKHPGMFVLDSLDDAEELNVRIERYGVAH